MRTIGRVAMAFIAIAVVLIVRPAHAAWYETSEIKALYEKAKAEGKVVVWGPQRNEVDWIPQAFNSMFPGIEVEWVGDNETLTRAITEARAGRHQVDVFWNSITGLVNFVNRDLVAPMDWATFGAPKENIIFDGRAAFTTSIAWAFAYNSERVKKEDLPTRWDQLLEPKYKDQIVTSLFLMPRLMGSLSLAWGWDKAEAFARDLIAKQNVMLTRSPREPIVNSGERLYSLGEVDFLVRIWQKSGLKLGYVVPEPIIVGQFTASVMAKAPHPNAARLLAGFMVSSEGKAARKALTSAEDYSITGTSDLAKRINSGKAQVVNDNPDKSDEREKAIQRMGPIVAGQK